MPIVVAGSGTGAGNQGFSLLIDPTTEDAANVELDISDGAANNGIGYRLLAPLKLPDFAHKSVWVSSIDTDGQLPAGPHGHDNGTLEVGLRITGSSAADLLTKVSNLRQKLEKLNREQGTLEMTFPSGHSYVWDVREARAHFDLGNAAVSRNRVEDRLIFTVAPGARGAEQSLGSFSETTLPWLVALVSGIDGDLAAFGRQVVTATAGDQLAVFFGAESRYYTSDATAALGYEAESRTPLSGAAAAVGATGASGGGSNVVRQGSLISAWAAMLSTQASGGGAQLTHKGAFQVLARVYRPTTNTGQVSLRFEYGQGDFTAWHANDPVTFAADTLEGVWTLVKLGPVHITPPRQGTHEWEGRIAAKSTVAGDVLDVDWIAFVPTDVHYAELAASADRYETPTAFLFLDDFTNTGGGNLHGRTPNVGAAWSSTAVDAADFSVSAASDHVSRAIANDADVNSGRYAIAGTGTAAAVLVQCDVRPTGLHSPTTSLAYTSVFARYTDANNWLMASVNWAAVANGVTTIPLVVRKRVGGTITTLATVPVELPRVASSTGEWMALRLVALPSGRWLVWWNRLVSNGALVAHGYDADLATGGALATGKYGLYDVNTAGSGSGRLYDNFYAATPVVDAVIYDGQSLELAHNRAERENAAGTKWTPLTVRGPYLRLAPAHREARSNRLFVKAVRGYEVQPNVWLDPSIDDIALDVFATPRFTAVPEP